MHNFLPTSMCISIHFIRVIWCSDDFDVQQKEKIFLRWQTQVNWIDVFFVEFVRYAFMHRRQKKQPKFHFITLSKVKLHFHKKFTRNLQQNDECGVIAFVMRRKNAIWNHNKIWLCLTISFSEHIFFRILICNFAEILNANIMCQKMGWVTATNVINSMCVYVCVRVNSPNSRRYTHEFSLNLFFFSLSYHCVSFTFKNVLRFDTRKWTFGLIEILCSERSVLAIRLHIFAHLRKR